MSGGLPSGLPACLRPPCPPRLFTSWFAAAPPSQQKGPRGTGAAASGNQRARFGKSQERLLILTAMRPLRDTLYYPRWTYEETEACRVGHTPSSLGREGAGSGSSSHSSALLTPRLVASLAWGPLARTPRGCLGTRHNWDLTSAQTRSQPCVPGPAPRAGVTRMS